MTFATTPPSSFKIEAPEVYHRDKYNHVIVLTAGPGAGTRMGITGDLAAAEEYARRLISHYDKTGGKLASQSAQPTPTPRVPTEAELRVQLAIVEAGIAKLQARATEREQRTRQPPAPQSVVQELGASVSHYIGGGEVKNRVPQIEHIASRPAETAAERAERKDWLDREMRCGKWSRDAPRGCVTTGNVQELGVPVGGSK